MILKMTVYYAKCDKCNMSHPKAGPKSLLKIFLQKDGWRVTTEGHVLCPHCAATDDAAKEEEE